MRALPVSVLTCGIVAVLGLSHCGPVASSLQKGVPSFGSISSGNLSEDDLTVSFATVVPESTLVSASSAKGASKSKCEAAAARLEDFKKNGQVAIPSSAIPSNGTGLNYDSISITIGVDCPDSMIQNIKQLPMKPKPIEADDQVYLVVSQKNASQGAIVQRCATSVTLKINGATPKKVTPGQQMPTVIQ